MIEHSTYSGECVYWELSELRIFFFPLKADLGLSNIGTNKYTVPQRLALQKTSTENFSWKNLKTGVTNPPSYPLGKNTVFYTRYI